MNRHLHTTVNVIALLFVAAVAFSVSFVAIRGYAIREGWSPPLANAAPLLVDSLTVLGASLVLARAHDSERAIYGWCLIVGASAVSLTVNVAHARPTIAAQLLAALPPVSLLASVEAVMSEARRSGRRSGRMASVGEQRPTGTTARTGRQAGDKRTRAASTYRALEPDERATITTRAFAVRAGVSPAYGARVLRSLRAPGEGPRSVGNARPDGEAQTISTGRELRLPKGGQETGETVRETEDAGQVSRVRVEDPTGNGSQLNGGRMAGTRTRAPGSDR